MVLTRSHRYIEMQLAEQGIGWIDLTGYQVENINGVVAVTRPAPDDEPRHYNARTNTGGRRLVCYL